MLIRVSLFIRVSATEITAEIHLMIFFGGPTQFFVIFVNGFLDGYRFLPRTEAGVDCTAPAAICTRQNGDSTSYPTRHVRSGVRSWPWPKRKTWQFRLFPDAARVGYRLAERMMCGLFCRTDRAAMQICQTAGVWSNLCCWFPSLPS